MISSLLFLIMLDICNTIVTLLLLIMHQNRLYDPLIKLQQSKFTGGIFGLHLLTRPNIIILNNHSSIYSHGNQLILKNIYLMILCKYSIINTFEPVSKILM